MMAKDLECNAIIDLYRLSESIKSLKLNIILFIMCIYRVTGNKLVVIIVIILCIITRELLLIFDVKTTRMISITYTFKIRKIYGYSLILHNYAEKNQL